MEILETYEFIAAIRMTLSACAALCCRYVVLYIYSCGRPHNGIPSHLGQRQLRDNWPRARVGWRSLELRCAASFAIVNAAICTKYCCIALSLTLPAAPCCVVFEETFGEIESQQRAEW